MSSPTGPYSQNPPPYGQAGYTTAGQPYAPPGMSYPPQQRQGCSWMGCLVGCLVMMLVMGVIVIGIGWYAMKKAPDFIRNQINDAIDKSELVAEDKQQVKAQVDRVVDQYKAGKINLQQVGEVLKELSESPLFPLAMIWAVEDKLIKPSGLSADEKLDAKLQLQRVARGVFLKKISEADRDRLMDYVTNKKGNGQQRELKESVSDDELRKFLKDCKDTADKAQVPNEPFQVKIGEEFKKAVDKALGDHGH